MSTAGKAVADASKTLLVAHHGWGKTFQARHYQKKYGKGLILSGESGLKSLEDVEIDYLPFSSWDGKHDPANGVFSFRGLCAILESDEFKAAGYKWIMLDSLTEVSERLLDHVEKVHEGNKNAFEKWGDYARMMTGALKWLRDRPYHVLVTCLAAEETDDNGAVNYWPLVKGQKVSKQIPALFDHVLCGVRITEDGPAGTPIVGRYVITDEVRGWHGKVRDPRRRLQPIEKCTDITELFDRMSAAE